MKFRSITTTVGGGVILDNVTLLPAVSAQAAARSITTAIGAAVVFPDVLKKIADANADGSGDHSDLFPADSSTNGAGRYTLLLPLPSTLTGVGDGYGVLTLDAGF